MSGLHIAGCLPGQIVAVALLVEIPLYLVEGWILTGLICLVVSQTVLPVPVKVQAGSILVYVLRMGYIELPVIVFGVIDAVLCDTWEITDAAIRAILSCEVGKIPKGILIPCKVKN